MAWAARLVEAGVDITQVDARHLRLRHRDDEVLVRLVRTGRRLYPSAVSAPPEPASLLVAPAASAAAAARARAAGWSLVTDAGPAWVRFSARHVLELPGQPERPPAPRLRPGRPPRGTMAAVRRLLLNAPVPQTRLATLAGVSQARVSQAFEPLLRADLVRRARDGWLPVDWDALCDWWLAHYPGPGGVTTWWSGLAAPLAQAAAAVRTLGGQAGPVLSGDVAADLLAPWRRPALAVVYARGGADLAAANLTLVPSSDGATLALVVPEDLTVWPTEPVTRDWEGRRLAVADALQVLYDLRRSPGPDAAEAAARWRARLPDRGWRGAGAS